MIALALSALGLMTVAVLLAVATLALLGWAVQRVLPVPVVGRPRRRLLIGRPRPLALRAPEGAE